MPGNWFVPPLVPPPGKPFVPFPGTCVVDWLVPPPIAWPTANPMPPPTRSAASPTATAITGQNHGGFGPPFRPGVAADPYQGVAPYGVAEGACSEYGPWDAYGWCAAYGSDGAGIEASSVAVEVGVGADPQPAGLLGYVVVGCSGAGCASVRSAGLVGVVSLMGRVHTPRLCAADDRADPSL